MRYAVFAVLLAAVAFAACGGDSAEEKAQTTVCDARADISKQVDQLKSLTPATFSVDAVTDGLSAIRSDLSNIKDAQGELDGERREAVQSANQEFESQVRQVATQIATSGSLANAQSEVTAAFQQLADTYEQTFAKVDCS